MDIDRIISEQHGIISRRQLREEGLTDAALEWRLRRGVWRRVLRGVYTVTTGPLTRPAQFEAALLAAGGNGALSHQSAAEEWGFDTGLVTRDPRVHVTRPIGRSSRTRAASTVQTPTDPFGPTFLEGGELHPGVVLHRSRAMRHIVVGADQPRISRADTVIDLAAAQPSGTEAFALALRLGSSRAVRLDDLRARLEKRAPWRYRKAVDDAVETLAGGVHSVLEAEFVLRVERPFGLPTPTRQVPVIVDGVVRYEDLVYERPGGRLIVRLDGKKFHLGHETRFRDRRRDNAAELEGAHRLIYGWEDVTGQAAGVASEILTLLARIDAAAA
jgi:hypothetical protein